MIHGACLCGAVRWQFDGEPEGATACNCSADRRYGALWAYGHEGEGVSVAGETRSYARGARTLEFHFCPTCGCMVFWRATEREAGGRLRIAVNLRLADPEAVAHIPIDHFEGLERFEDLPRDGRRVADYWF
ncbi:MAG: GFA family protein [Acetobacteraceae bacterium]|nr:MAG: GFA family protein [Acetobacteraceae bacterium]